MIATITNHISKGVTNIDDTDISMMWFKTNFNMPVKDYMTGSWVRYQGAWTYDVETTSYDLSGFVPGYEICNGAAIFDFENDGASTYEIDTDLTVKWVDHDNSTVMYYVINAFNYTYSLPAGYYVETWWAGNIGCAGWEIHSNDTYYFKSSASGTPNIAEVSTGIDITNCPSVAFLGATKPGHIWIEGNDLCYINANQWKHTMVGVALGATGLSPGYIWIDTNNILHWVGGDGKDYTNRWQVKQFASFYGNGPTEEVYAGTSKKGSIWIDNEFGWTHLSYIGYDGYKYLMGAGENPY